MDAKSEFDWGARSVVGHVRKVNEDAFIAQPPVFAVADGMGGHSKGDVASRIVIDELAGLCLRANVSADAVASIVDHANHTVREEGAHDPEGKPMGTTLTAAVMVTTGAEHTWLVVNVGDSRVYRVAHGTIEQLTIDHSLVEEYVAARQISPEEARRHPQRNVITRAMGSDDNVLPDFLLCAPVVGERLVLCSDGVHGELTDAEICTLVATAPTAQAAADAVIEQVLLGRARDNATIVVVESLHADSAHDDAEATGPLQTVIKRIPLSATAPTSADPAASTIDSRIVDVPISAVTDRATDGHDESATTLITTVPTPPAPQRPSDGEPMITLPTAAPPPTTQADTNAPEVDTP